ncbi:MAG: glycosyl hydrolase 108 family protein [Candidatus Binataceae bacterium]
MHNTYPAEFLGAVANLLGNEGGYIDDPEDPGGETKWGISKREYPDLDIKNLGRAAAIAIYYRDWWMRYRYDALPAEVGAKIFNLAVDIGPGPAAICLQRALRANQAWWRDEFPNIGPMTKETTGRVYAREPAALMAALRSELASWYRVEAMRQNKDKEFLKGWLNRAYE